MSSYRGRPRPLVMTSICAMVLGIGLATTGAAFSAVADDVPAPALSDGTDDVRHEAEDVTDDSGVQTDEGADGEPNAETGASTAADSEGQVGVSATDTSSVGDDDASGVSDGSGPGAGVAGTEQEGEAESEVDSDGSGQTPQCMLLQDGWTTDAVFTDDGVLVSAVVHWSLQAGASYTGFDLRFTGWDEILQSLPADARSAVVPSGIHHLRPGEGIQYVTVFATCANGEQVRLPVNLDRPGDPGDEESSGNVAAVSAADAAGSPAAVGTTDGGTTDLGASDGAGAGAGAGGGVAGVVGAGAEAQAASDTSGSANSVAEASSTATANARVDASGVPQTAAADPVAARAGERPIADEPRSNTLANTGLDARTITSAGGVSLLLGLVLALVARRRRTGAPA